MKKFLSRVAASITTLAMLATYAIIPAFAAGIASSAIEVNGSAIASIAVDTQITTIAFTPTTALADGDSITINYDNDSDDTGLVFGDITADNVTGGGNFAAGVISVDTANNRITIPVTTAGNAGEKITVTLSNSHLKTPLTAQMLSVSVTTSDDVGANVIPVGDANIVVVTAVVEPTLTLTLSANTVDLGILSPSAITTAAGPTITVATNAQSGFDLKVASDNGNASAGLYSTTATNEIDETAAAVGAGAAEGFDLDLTETGDTGTNADVDLAAGFDGLFTTAAKTVADSAGPTQLTATTDLNASITPLTPAASDYTTSLTFTATANF
jgi:hypothetical protein